MIITSLEDGTKVKIVFTIHKDGSVTYVKEYRT